MSIKVISEKGLSGHFHVLLTVELYEGLLRIHLNPTFDDMAIGDIKEEHMRKWRAARLKAGPKSASPFGPVTVAKAYRLLRAILNTAVKDKRIKENPCQIEGADKESSPERPVLSVAEVFRLADAITPRYRALVLLATFGNMRWASWPGCGVATSTWRAGRCGSTKRSTSWDHWSRALPSQRPASARSYSRT